MMTSGYVLGSKLQTHGTINSRRIHYSWGCVHSHGRPWAFADNERISASTSCSATNCCWSDRPSGATSLRRLYRCTRVRAPGRVRARPLDSSPVAWRRSFQRDYSPGAGRACTFCLIDCDSQRHIAGDDFSSLWMGRVETDSGTCDHRTSDRRDGVLIIRDNCLANRRWYGTPKASSCLRCPGGKVRRSAILGSLSGSHFRSDQTKLGSPSFRLQCRGACGAGAQSC